MVENTKEQGKDSGTLNGDNSGEELTGSGVNDLSDVELLSIIISTGVKGRPAHSIASEIIEKFGSFKRMASQPLEEFLKQIKGLGDVKIKRIATAFEIARRCIYVNTEQSQDKNTSGRSIIPTFLLLLPLIVIMNGVIYLFKYELFSFLEVYSKDFGTFAIFYGFAFISLIVSIAAFGIAFGIGALKKSINKKFLGFSSAVTGLLVTITFLIVIYSIHKSLPLDSQAVRNAKIEGPPAAKMTEEKLEPFEKGTFGVLVASFEGKTKAQTNDGKKILNSINSSLNARIRELEISDIVARKIASSLIPLKTHEDAGILGRLYNAGIVIWGEASGTEIIQKISIVNPQSRVSFPDQPETTSLGEKNYHRGLANLVDFSFPVLSDSPNLLTSFLLGLKYYYGHDYKKALDYFTASIQETPTKHFDSPQISLYIGNVHYLTKKYEDAISIYGKILSANSGLFEAYNNRGVALMRIGGEYEQAISDYDKALEINPDYFVSYINRGNAFQIKGKFDKAISDYDKALKIKPNDAVACFQRGNAYRYKGDYGQAIKDYTKALEINPKYFEAYNNRGATYLSKGEHDKAISDYNKVLEKYPDDVIGHNNRGLAYQGKGDYDNAVYDFNKILEINPNDSDAYYNRGLAYQDKKEHKKAIADFNKALKLKPDLIEVYFYKALVCEKAKLRKEAIKAYKSFIKLAPPEYSIHIEHAWQQIKILEQ